MDRCPYCLQDIKSLIDFPQVKIHKFERLSIPEFFCGELKGYQKDKLRKGLVFKRDVDNPDISAEVLRKLREKKGLVQFNGFLYDSRPPFSDTYGVYEDRTPQVKALIESQEVKKTLSTLEASVGKIMDACDILDLRMLNHIQNKDAIYSNPHLSFKEENIFGGRVRFSELLLIAGNNPITLPELSLPLARIFYEGMILEEPIDDSI